MSRGTVEIPIEVWEACQRDAERIAFLHKQSAALAAENERLRIQGGEAEPRFVLLSDYRHLKAQLDTLTAENERLRKAGDAMFNCAVQDSTGLWLLKPFQYWEKFVKGAAK